MYNDFTDLSPNDKINKYNDINGTQGNASNYVEYIPNESSGKTQPVEMPKVDINALSSSYAPLNPIITKTTDLTKPIKKDAESKLPLTDLNNTNGSTGYITPIPYKVTAPNDSAKQAFNYYLSKGVAPHVAAGIVGNLYQESGVDANRKQNDGGPGRGVAQWTENGRWKGLQKWASANGRDVNNLHTQLDYILVEPGQERAIKKTMATKDSAEAALVFGKYFEAPKEGPTARWDIRQGIARSLYH
jgi:hypothetical protein